MKTRIYLRILLLFALLGQIWPAAFGQVDVRRVKDINPGSSSSPQLFAAVGNTLFFVADDGTGQALWKSDGTENGTMLVKNTNPDGWDNLSDLVNFNGTLYFAASNGIDGKELWKSDGTENGTVMVKDINPSGDSYPDHLVVVGNALFFVANDGTNGEELWKSDGTENGTVLVKDIRPGAAGSNPGNLTAAGSLVFFNANDGTHGRELWRSDGTEGGTILLKDIFMGSDDSFPAYFAAVGSTLFFSASDNAYDRELYKSDGTPGGTLRVKNINLSGNGQVVDLGAVGGTVFFEANDGIHGAELWKSDGTESGTVLVKDMVPGPGSSTVNSPINVNGTLFFIGNDGVHYDELWKSDGTAAGTVMVKDIRAGSSSSISYMTALNGRVFFQANDGIHNNEPWMSDGTEGGTVMVKDINENPGSGSSPSNFAVVGNRLFLSATDGITGTELYSIRVLPPCDNRVALYPATPGRVCQGQDLVVSFSTMGSCPEPPADFFLVQLSSATGSFANPTVLGYANVTTPTYPNPAQFVFPANLFANLPSGTGYRIRIVTPTQTSQPSLPFRLESPTLSVTPGVTGAPVCRGGQVSVSFQLPAGSCPFPQGNVFTAQLSSSTGSFANPVSLGPVQAGVANSVTIPVGSAAGTGYRIRIVSSSPALTSSASAPLRVNAVGCTNRMSAEEPNLVVVPNPVVGGEIRLRVSGLDNPAFGLTTGTGRSMGVSVKTDGSGEFVLTPRQRLAPGVYLLQASEGQTRLTTRVLVTE
jgi:ELWxxDGT repeat protein